MLRVETAPTMPHMENLRFGGGTVGARHRNMLSISIDFRYFISRLRR
jgi:hypothetical protein